MKHKLIENQERIMEELYLIWGEKTFTPVKSAFNPNVDRIKKRLKAELESAIMANIKKA